MNKASLIALTFARLRNDLSESQVSRDRLVACSKQAMDRLCDVAASQPKLAQLLVKRYDCTIETGAVDLTDAAFSDLHRGSLQMSRFYGPDDSVELYPYIWRDFPHELDGFLDPTYGYYSASDTRLILRTPIDGEEASSSVSGTGRLYAMQIPFLSDGELPDNGELWQLASDLLANEYLKLAPAAQ